MSLRDSKRFLITGTFKFPIDRVSLESLYEASSRFVEEYENVEMLSIRPCDNNEWLAVDIRFNPEGYDIDEAYNVFTFDLFKPFFKREFGEDYATWWELHDTVYIVK